MNYLDYNCQDCKSLNDGHLFTFVAAYTWWGAGDVQEPFGVAFHHVGPTFINTYISRKENSVSRPLPCTHSQKDPPGKMVFQGPGGLFGSTSGYMEVALKHHFPLPLILFQGSLSPPRRVFHLERAEGQCFTNISCFKWFRILWLWSQNQ